MTAFGVVFAVGAIAAWLANTEGNRGGSLALPLAFL